MTSVYDSARLAEAYAFDRPPVLEQILHTVAPHAGFVIGRAERLPFPAGSFDLITAAGSLNYADFPSALAEIARVLTPDGTFLLYDFSPGRSSAGDDKLERWFASFEQRFPWPPGWEPLDPRELPLAAYGLQLLDFTEVETQLPMDADAYLRYALSETNVENSIATGACGPEEARDWCQTTLESVFTNGPVTVVIDGHVATLARAAESDEQ